MFVLGKYIKIIKRGFVGVFVLGVLFMHFYAPRVITEIDNPILGLFRKNIPDISEFEGEGGKTIWFCSFDETELCAYVTYAKTDTVKGTIILLHGIRAYKEHFKTLSHQLAERGFNAVALDLRAHGQSKGKHCTFGVKEKKDISELITYLIQQENLKDPIGVWGQSLGGAVGLQSMGYDKRIKFGIIESTFSDFRTITRDYFQYHTGLKIDWLTDYLVYRSGKIADFNPDEARPEDFCRLIEQPTLLVHGNKDRRIDIQYGKENFNALKSKEKEFLEVDNATHLSVWKTGGDEYFEKVYRFLESMEERN